MGDVGIRTRTPLALCLAVLVLTAGCNEFGGGAETTTTTTETPTTAETTATTETTTTTTTETTTTETTTTTTENATSFPPGIAENGTIVDAQALADAHRELLLSEGAVAYVNQTSSHPDYENVSAEVRIATGGGEFYWDQQAMSGPARVTPWANYTGYFTEATAATRVRENGTTTYYATWNGSTLPAGPTQSEWIATGMGDANQSTVVETKVVDGVRYTTLRVVNEIDNETATFTLNATGTGLVVDYEYTYPVSAADAGFNGTITRSYDLRQVGDVTVERPDWTSEALNETNQTAESSA